MFVGVVALRYHQLLRGVDNGVPQLLQTQPAKARNYRYEQERKLSKYFLVCL